MYLREIANHDLLTQQDEVSLAQHMEAGRLASARLSTDDGLGAAERERLQHLVEDGENARRHLIECNLPPRCHLTPWLAGLFVRADHRDRGVGTALTRFCEAEAAALGVRMLYLYTERAEGFYQRLGWTTLESLEWEGEPVAVMSRELRAHAPDS